MEDNNSQDVIPQQEVETESVKRSEMCIGLNYVMMTLPKNTVTGITIMIAQPVTNPTLKRAQLVTNNITQGMEYINVTESAKTDLICTKYTVKTI